MNWSTENLRFDNKQIIRDKVLCGLTGGEFEFPTSKPYYKNDRRMRAPNITFDYTDEEIKSLAVLEKDPAYTIELVNSTQMPIAVLLGPPTGLVLRDYQKEALDNYQNKRFNIIIGSRQTGSKNTLAIQALHYAITHTNKNVIIFSRNSASAEDILDKVKEFYKDMPYYSKPGIREFNQKKVVFDNGSRIFAKPLTKNTPIGFTIDFMILNDYAFVTNTIAKSTQYLFPIMNAISNSKITIASTPNGDNHFKDLVFDDKNAYHKQWIYYHQVQGRDQAWVDRTISDIGSLEAFIQEYELLFTGSKEWIRRLNIDKLV